MQAAGWRGAGAALVSAKKYGSMIGIPRTLNGMVSLCNNHGHRKITWDSYRKGHTVQRTSAPSPVARTVTCTHLSSLWPYARQSCLLQMTVLHSLRA